MLITRPEPGLTASCNAARELGLNPVAGPLFTVEPVDWEIEQAFDSVLIGSANVLRHGGDKLARLKEAPVYAVGDTTAAAVHASGLSVAFSGSDGLESCVDALLRDGHSRPLRLTGRRHTKLQPRPNLSVETVICYETQNQPLGAEAAKALENPCVIMAYSAAAVEAVEVEMARLGLATSQHMLLVISQRAANSATAQWQSVHVAERPDDAAMLAQARILCQRG
ncbi:uroporphyrinogen-III synthase [Alterisphingorhabdus coralli]|uniref:Uroporphyrinogen-III synthase n=1 Tax=Alterisphingorhabdus coralli TaxID=3071408 RepID=A0AA97F955_9SPHN|nr:uroporphyrinogen-III synthase [Parasphingorhabdus sp. SCSIO 66989]WOE75327.1 uroporphyrinogen-III synthase [Parasphingorhabdus sp. SCSIO 66989]